jgi:phosphoglycolate phosphatase
MRLGFADLGIPPLDVATERSLVGPPWATMLPPLIGDRNTDEVIAAYRRHYVDGGLMYDTKLYPGVVDLLDALRDAGVSMAVATSKPEEYAVPIVERLGLTSYFATVCGDGLHSERGTKALVITEALRRLGYPDTAETVMVGDRVHDVEGAAVHGIPTLGARWGYSDGDELERAGAVRVLDSADDLRRALPELLELP